MAHYLTIFLSVSTTSTPCSFAGWPEGEDADYGASSQIRLETHILCWEICYNHYPGFYSYQRHRGLSTHLLPLHDVTLRALWDTSRKQCQWRNLMRQRSSGQTWRRLERTLHPPRRGSPSLVDPEGEETLGGHQPELNLVGPDGHLQVWREADVGQTWTSQILRSLGYCQALKAKG